jgi:hypothetical protein
LAARKPDPSVRPPRAVLTLSRRSERYPRSRTLPTPTLLACCTPLLISSLSHRISMDLCEDLRPATASDSINSITTAGAAGHTRPPRAQAPARADTASRGGKSSSPHQVECCNLYLSSGDCCGSIIGRASFEPWARQSPDDTLPLHHLRSAPRSTSQSRSGWSRCVIATLAGGGSPTPSTHRAHCVCSILI